ncbi:MAG: hypothetical protein JSS84_03390 [Bacteroidetes bacterium]|nr:hypothetical protein [Bacteroidota bacterium]
MRLACTILLVACSLAASPQPAGTAPRPLVVVESVALPLSMAQVEKAARAAWPFTFGEEPGAKVLEDAPGSGRLEGSARFNFRASTVGNRLQTLGVINYHISISAENGQCKLRFGQFTHTGNANAPGGAVSIGPLYEGDRPLDPVPGIGILVAARLHEDMRQQVVAHVREVAGRFAQRLRMDAESR